MEDIYESIEEYNLNKKCKMLILIDDSINHLSNTNFKDTMNFTPKIHRKPYSFLVDGNTLPSDNHLHLLFLE